MKDLHYAELFEIYKNLLNDLRKKISYEYYLCDLSMGEIAEENGMSRQSVNDCLKKTREQLDEIEGKMKLYEKLKVISDGFGEEVASKVIEIIKE